MNLVNEKALNDILVEVEKEVKNISSAIQVLSKSNLKRDTIVTLIQVNTTPRLTREQISNVIDSIRDLSKFHLKG